MRRDVFQAIADPTRRNIISLIAKQPMNLNAIAENFHTSRPAISKHIRILAECGLVVMQQQGRERYCTANLKQLKDVSNWIDKYKIFWMGKLDALENHLNENARIVSKNLSPKKTIK